MLVQSRMYCMFRLIAAIIKYINLYNHPSALARVYSGNTLYMFVSYAHCPDSVNFLETLSRNFCLKAF
jgi:hypothetical protein